MAEIKFRRKMSGDVGAASGADLLALADAGLLQQ
jgi:hypothetical protein